MNKYKSVENLLYNYNMFKISIENMEQEIHYIKNNCGLSALNYDGISTSPTFKISSMTENIALSNSEKIEFLEHNIKRNKMQIDIIDRSLEALTESETTILKLRYIEGKQWWQVGSVVRYGERHCKRVRTGAIEKMVTGIYGIKE